MHDIHITDEHRYFLDDGTELCSVSKLIGRYKQTFNESFMAKRVADRDGLDKEDVIEAWHEKRDRSVDIGTRVHEYIHATISGDFVSATYDDDIELYIAAFEKFRIDHPFTTIGSEMIIGAPKLLLAGTLDALLMMSDGRVWLIDWKTNEKITRYGVASKMRKPVTRLRDCNWIHYTLQSTAYTTMLEGNYGYGDLDKRIGRALVHLLPDGNYVIYYPRFLETEFTKMLVQHKEAWPYDD